MKQPILYDPKPLNTDLVLLSDELSILTEKIAEALHDVWARKRLDEGWTWGAQRNDRDRTTPCLVPFDNLPEQEKEYDRGMVVATAKMLLSMGYRIEKD